MLSKQTIEKLVAENKDHFCQDEHAFGGMCVKIAAIAQLPTRFGMFQIVSFENNFDKKEHAAVIKGDIYDAEEVVVRLHSECLTGDALGSLRCDCRDQLTTSLTEIGKMDKGIVLYLRQEGRGIGFVNKIKAYALQDTGVDTIEADKMLGFSGDERDYDIAAHMLSSLKVKSIKLMTNNPKKIEDLQSHGVEITARIPLIIPANEYNKAYLETKRVKAHHMFEQQEESILDQNHSDK